MYKRIIYYFNKQILHWYSPSERGVGGSITRFQLSIRFIRLHLAELRRSSFSSDFISYIFSGLSIPNNLKLSPTISSHFSIPVSLLSLLYQQAGLEFSAKTLSIFWYVSSDNTISDELRHSSSCFVLVVQIILEVTKRRPFTHAKESCVTVIQSS